MTAHSGHHHGGEGHDHHAWGILLTPAFGAVLMSGSTVVVAINAQLLKRTAI